MVYVYILQTVDCRYIKILFKKGELKKVRKCFNKLTFFKIFCRLRFFFFFFFFQNTFLYKPSKICIKIYMSLYNIQ